MSSDNRDLASAGEETEERIAKQEKRQGPRINEDY
jgi:hypothetical protein